MRKHISLEEIVEKQQIRRISAEEFFNSAKELEIEESSEELLLMLD